MKTVAPVIAPLLLLVTAASIAAPKRETQTYPVAPRDQIVADYLGTRVPAPYRWMEHMQSPVLHRWVAAENRLTDAYSGEDSYPPTLITTSWDDDRVVPMHEFKFTAAVQRVQACANPILLRTTGATSHTYMPTDKQIAQTAEVWAFEAYNLGLREPPAD